MYNRYIPQPDGSYRRRRIQDPSPPPYHPPQSKPEPAYTQEQQHYDSAPEPRLSPQPDTRPYRSPQPRKPQQYRPPKQEPRDDHREAGVGGFLRQLLPKDFDTGDLMIVLLLLLMAGDCDEDQNSALLTLALYFFM